MAWPATGRRRVRWPPCWWTATESSRRELDARLLHEVLGAAEGEALARGGLEGLVPEQEERDALRVERMAGHGDRAIGPLQRGLEELALTAVDAHQPEELC